MSQKLLEFNDLSEIYPNCQRLNNREDNGLFRRGTGRKEPARRKRNRARISCGRLRKHRKTLIIFIFLAPLAAASWAANPPDGWSLIRRLASSSVSTAQPHVKYQDIGAMS
jgi:hypothetical protein